MTHAFIEGLKARGVRVTELPRLFSPGDSQVATRLAITGVVREFESTVLRTGVFTYDHKVACRVALQVYDNRAGGMLWEKSYSRYGDDVWFRGARFFAKALAEIVEEAINDAGLVSRLRARED